MTVLEGLTYEAKGDIGSAAVAYRDLNIKDPTNPFPYKRRASMFKSQGKMDFAVKELNKYLSKFQSDVSAWKELADIYIEIQKYSFLHNFLLPFFIGFFLIGQIFGRCILLGRSSSF